MLYYVQWWHSIFIFVVWESRNYVNTVLFYSQRVNQNFSQGFGKTSCTFYVKILSLCRSTVPCSVQSFFIFIISVDPGSGTVGWLTLMAISLCHGREKCNTMINELCPRFTHNWLVKDPWHLLSDSLYTSLLLQLKHIYKKHLRQNYYVGMRRVFLRNLLQVIQSELVISICISQNVGRFGLHLQT